MSCPTDDRAFTRATPRSSTIAVRLDDSDVHWHRPIKATVGGVTAAVTGDPAAFVPVSAAHRDPTAAVQPPPSWIS